MRTFAIAIGVCVLALGLAAQEVSLGDVARASKAKPPSAKAKVVVDSDNIRGSKLPIPDVRLDNDNSEEIVAAILQYSSAHSAKETEEMVHNWYDRQDGVAQSAADEVRRTTERQQESYYDLPSDVKNYEKYQQEQRAKELQRRQDSRSLIENRKLMQRTAATLLQVKYKLATNRMNYEWMKPRYSYDY